VLKDNIDTGDRMLTTAGSLALADRPAPKDAFLVARLRAAGVVILGKTNLSEWANFRSTHSTSGWSARGGLVKNPYILDRNACGSSSGTGAAIAASLAAVGVGTETDGSIVCPSAATGLVGIKPTVGLVSRTGVIPISHTQDTAGPMGRTVADAVASARYAGRDLMRSLTAGALRGARIGVARRKYFGYHPGTDGAIAQALGEMKAAGAILIDPADIATASQLDACEMPILLTEFKSDLRTYLQARGATANVHSLDELIAFNTREKTRELPYFGQELFVEASRTHDVLAPEYVKALTTCRTLSRADGIDATLRRFRLDAIVAPTAAPAWKTDLVNGDHILGASSTPAAVAGYPSITVPAGFVDGLPVGISFIGSAWSEPRLIELAYSYEQATKHRRPPEFRDR